MSEHGFIYVRGWKKFQHPDAVRSSHMPWLKLHTDLLGNDKWLALEPTDRTLLQTIWMLTARYGHGRVIADLRWLQGQANLPLSNRYRGLERLSDAGFITIRASKTARNPASKAASLDVEGSKDPKKRGSAREAQPPPAPARATEKPIEPEPNGWHGAAEARDRLHALVQGKELA